MPEKDALYICIEPWQGCAAFEDNPYAVLLTPRETKTLAFTAEVI